MLLRAAIAIIALLAGARPVSAKPRVVLDYWEKWTLFEQKAMEAVVDDFNKAQGPDGIFVRYIMTSDIDEKALIAIAGGDPPDLVGLGDYDLVSYADKNAFMPLDKYLKDAGIVGSSYLPAYWNDCIYHGQMWAVPTTPASVALHWNKGMFRKAGLDPEKPPRSIDELDRMAERLVVKDSAGHITQMGFLPSEPGWWNWAWPYFFGGQLWDGKGTITCDSKECIAAFAWIQSYAKKYGEAPVQVFSSGFNNAFASPQNAFMANKVAMEVQGTWMYNFIHEFNPTLEWGAAPIPTSDPKLYGRSIVDLDILAIPRGARHPNESFEFIKYLLRQGPLEKLCLGQRKFTTLKAVSAAFVKDSPNPYIQLFIKLAGNPLTFALPQLTFWQEYNAEMGVAFDQVYHLQATPEEALGSVKRKMQKLMDREVRRLKRLGLEPA